MIVPTKSYKSKSAKPLASGRRLEIFLDSDPGFPFLKEDLNAIKKKNSLMGNLKKYRYKKHLFEKKYDFRNISFPDETKTFKNKSLILIHDRGDFLKFNILSEYFTGEPRMKCKRKFSKISPFNFYNQNKKMLGKYCLEKTGSITPHCLREAIFELKPAIICSSFRPNNLVAILQILGLDNSKTVLLDPSSGWGDRALASHSVGIRYIGVDPNPNVFDGYSEMSSFFKFGKRIKFIQSPFEDVSIPRMKYNIVFTSPPYFDFEKYSDEKGQSVVRYKNVRLWFEKFIKVVILRSWKVLEDGGYFIMNINHRFKSDKYVYWMIDFIYKRFKNSYFYGILPYECELSKGNPQPIFIWRKSSTVPKDLFENYPKKLIEDIGLEKGGKYHQKIESVETSKICHLLRKRCVFSLRS